MTIDTNEVLYRTTKALNFSEKELLEAFTLEEYKMDISHLNRLLKRRLEKDFMLCSYEELGIFLDGLVTLKRGPSPKRNINNDEIELTTNLILKKLRIALELKEHEVEIIFGLGEVTLSKQQLASLFRKEEHKNFKKCSNDLLLSFLEGLDEFYYTGEENENED